MFEVDGRYKDTRTSAFSEKEKSFENSYAVYNDNKTLVELKSCEIG